MDNLKLISVGVGVLVILVAAVSALKDKMSLYHVACMAIGAVLAGVPYVNLSGPEGLNMQIGTVAQAAAANTQAAQVQNDALTQTNQRIDQIASLISDLVKAQAAMSAAQVGQGQADSAGPAATPPVAPEVIQGMKAQITQLQGSSQMVQQRLDTSRKFSLFAAKKLAVKPPPPLAAASQ